MNPEIYAATETSAEIESADEEKSFSSGCCVRPFQYVPQFGEVHLCLNWIPVYISSRCTILP
jgi:hypothetical protein